MFALHFSDGGVELHDSKNTGGRLLGGVGVGRADGIEVAVYIFCVRVTLLFFAGRCDSVGLSQMCSLEL